MAALLKLEVQSAERRALTSLWRLAAGGAWRQKRWPHARCTRRGHETHRREIKSRLSTRLRLAARHAVDSGTTATPTGMRTDREPSWTIAVATTSAVSRAAHEAAELRRFRDEINTDRASSCRHESGVPDHHSWPPSAHVVHGWFWWVPGVADQD